jgi:hypothetical protein
MRRWRSERNSLSVDQVSAILEGKAVIGPPRDIQEVRNAITTLDALPRCLPSHRRHLLEAHGLLMAGLAGGHRLASSAHQQRGALRAGVHPSLQQRQWPPGAPMADTDPQPLAAPARQASHRGGVHNRQAAYYASLGPGACRAGPSRWHWSRAGSQTWKIPACRKPLSGGRRAALLSLTLAGAETPTCA